MSQCRPHCLTDKWSLIRCRNTTDITTNTEELNISKGFMEPNITAAEPFWDAEWKRSCKIRWRSGRGSKAQSDKQAGVFLLGQSFWISESWLYVKRENGSSNYQWTQWDHFLHAGWHFDLRGNNESNQKLTLALPLGSQPICDMFTLGSEDLHVSVWLFVCSQPLSPSSRHNSLQTMWKVKWTTTLHVSVVSH